jgi:hypothetical protein
MKPIKVANTNRLAFKQSLGTALMARPITVYQPNGDLTGVSAPLNGRVTIEGPHYPEPHRWYANAVLENGEVVKVS